MYELYVLDTCPYCHRVMEFFNNNNIKYLKKVVTNEENRDELLRLGGKEQVPFLYEPEKDIKMYESDKIMEFVSENE